MSQPRYILVGGFFGAGKTAALLNLARQLATLGRRVAVIVNDHGGESIDAVEFRMNDFPVEEIGNGDLASRFASFASAAKKLEAACAPDVVLVEAVGTSVDLAAAVARPLREIEGRTVAPLSVLIDPLQAEQVFGLAPGRSLPVELVDLYRRQIEEASILVLAQTDRLDAARLEKLRGKLTADFPSAQIVEISTTDALGVTDWLALLDSSPAVFTPHETGSCIEGVAAVGCLNAVIEITLGTPAPAPALQESIARHLQRVLADVDVLHLQAALRGDETQLGITHLVGDGELHVARSFPDVLEYGELLINLRAATHPEQLHTAVRAAIVGMAGEFPGLVPEFAHLHYFRPPQPDPLHRTGIDPR